MGFRDWIDQNLSISLARPAQSLWNGAWWIPLVLFGLVAGVRVEGNPISNFASSLGLGARRAIGTALTETTPNMIEASESIYGRPTQQGKKFQRMEGSGTGSNADCQEMNGWMYCPNRR